MVLAVFWIFKLLILLLQDVSVEMTEILSVKKEILTLATVTDVHIGGMSKKQSQNVISWSLEILPERRKLQGRFEF